MGGRDTPLCPSDANCAAPEEPALSDGAAYNLAEGGADGGAVNGYGRTLPFGGVWIRPTGRPYGQCLDR